MIRKVCIRIVTSSIFILLTMVSAELVTRTLGGKPAAFIYSGSFRDHQVDWDVDYGVNRDGLRITCETAGEDRRPKFAIIGDSYAFGQGVGDCETLASRLAERLPQRHFVNYGSIGIGVYQYQLIARDMIAPDAADVLILFYGNDISDLATPRAMFGYIADQSAAFAFLRKMKQLATVRLFTARSSGEQAAFDNVSSIIGRDSDYFATLTNPSQIVLADFRKEFGTLIAYLQRAVSREHIWIAVVPEATTVSRQVRAYVQSKGGNLPAFGKAGSSYEEVRLLAEREHLHFIDLFPAFSEAADRAYFPHDLHWNAEGHKVAAKEIAQAIEGRSMR